MIICPHCDTENIKGNDTCEQCGQALVDLHLPKPASHVEKRLLRDRLKVLNPHLPESVVTPETRVGDVVQMLAERSIGCVLVVDDEKLVGIFSERDALLKLNTRATELKDRPISDFMTRVPQVLDIEAKIVYAIHRMDLGTYRHVPITDSDGRPTAILSVRDILRYLRKTLEENGCH